MPAHYPTNSFEVCHTENAQDIAFYNGVEYHQKDGPPPDPHPAPKYLDCKPIQEKDLYGEISAGAFSSGNATYTSYNGPLDHSSPANAGGVAVNNPGTNAGAQAGAASNSSNSNAVNNGGSGAMAGAGASNHSGSGGSATSQKPTSTNAAVSVETSRQIGMAFVALVTGLLAGCIFL